MTTNTTMPTIQVEINNVNGQHVPTITSLQVAEVFGKRHYHVLRDIEEILTQVSEKFMQTNFGEYEWTQQVGFGERVNKPMYHADTARLLPFEEDGEGFGFEKEETTPVAEDAGEPRDF